MERRVGDKRQRRSPDVDLSSVSRLLLIPGRSRLRLCVSVHEGVGDAVIPVNPGSCLDLCIHGHNPVWHLGEEAEPPSGALQRFHRRSCGAAVTMGNTKSSALSRELLEDLKSHTRYGEAELCSWYQSFLKECPGGKISKEQFEGIYASFFPNADPSQYARHVFRSFDTNADGMLDFKEYMVALHLTSGGKTLQKLEWAFALYDVDGNGTISKNEILEIVRVQNRSPFA